MIARMKEDGTITIEPQNGTEVVALKAWAQLNRITLPDTTTDNGAGMAWRGPALEILVRDSHG